MTDAQRISELQKIVSTMELAVHGLERELYRVAPVAGGPSRKVVDRVGIAMRDAALTYASDALCKAANFRMSGGWTK